MQTHSLSYGNALAHCVQASKGMPQIPGVTTYKGETIDKHEEKKTPIKLLTGEDALRKRGVEIIALEILQLSVT